MKNVVAYVRVSTDEQAENGYGKYAQEAHIKEYAAQNGYQILDWYYDLGVSGNDDSPPALMKLINRDNVSNPPVEAVLIGKTDRLSRNIYKHYHYKYVLQHNGIEVLSVTENFGDAGYFTPILEAFLIASAEVERDNIRARTSGGRYQKASRGGYAGGRAPFGYKVEDGGLVINEDEAPAVRRMFELRDQGLTLRDVAETLNEEGYRTRTGLKFAFNSLNVTLNNRLTYEGYYKYGEDSDWVEGQHEAILDRRNDGE